MQLSNPKPNPVDSKLAYDYHMIYYNPEPFQMRETIINLLITFIMQIIGHPQTRACFDILMLLITFVAVF